ncbi:LOW QUALITY PROTEIN: Hypothetical protein PHPALM_12102 [Phytophthora palmivora]|uniref:Uncharacterized protein n=1 Tax=Phytophthora palmivora TaxID=4796 RepID=A0A2P4Y0L5_9STRA|nr:LOW QUALITY PROTEIN: Hypothetical protein PHPALM_12102 [Phytophthora palmivora]
MASCNLCLATSPQWREGAESSGDSQGFHRESDEESTKIKLEPGIEALAKGVSSQTLLSEAQ